MRWLMKAEPDSRIVKGQDIKFSVDDFERLKISPWEGVRSYEARNILRDKMLVGHKVLFYHSNCKNPGIAGFARVAKEAYPDHTAWDESHPYFDPKTDRDKPRWYMVDVEFVSRAKYFVPLALLRHLATLTEPPACLPEISPSDLEAIKNMTLLNKGRLSVQPVEETAWAAIEKLAADGGWEELLPAKRKKKETKGDGDSKAKGKKRPKRAAARDADDGDSSELTELSEEDVQPQKRSRRSQG